MTRPTDGKGGRALVSDPPSPGRDGPRTHWATPVHKEQHSDRCGGGLVITIIIGLQSDAKREAPTGAGTDR